MNPSEIKIVKKKSNELLKRIDISFIIYHEGKSTPNRKDLADILSSKLDVKNKYLYIKNIRTKAGKSVSNGKASIYESTEQANLVEPEYIIQRNSIE